MKNYYDYWNTKQKYSGTSWQLGMSEKWNDRPLSPDAVWIEPLLSKYDIKTVSDVACGTGRMFPLWHKHGLTGAVIEWSDVLYPPMSKNAESYGLTPYKLDLTMETTEQAFDLVFATQFLLHIRPRDIRLVFENLIEMSKGLIAVCAWYDPEKVCIDDKADYDSTHNWSHPYYALFNEFGLEVLLDDTLKFADGSTNKAWLLELSV